MCLILFAWQTRPDLPLVIAANRDEIRSRATLALHRWPDLPIIAGRDELAGGTWMGVSADDPYRVAAVTNVRTGLVDGNDPSRASKRSRGRLPVDYLVGDSTPKDYAIALVSDAAHYEPVNLLVADADELWWATTWPEPIARRVEPGVHGISNAELDSRWPKVIDGTARLTTVLSSDRPDADPEPYFDLLADRRRASDDALPATGVPEAFERALSPIFIDIPASAMPVGRDGIRAGDYGTRASTVLRVGGDGHGQVTERRFLARAEPLGESTVRFAEKRFAG